MHYGTAIGHVADRTLEGVAIDKENVKIPYELRFKLPEARKQDFAFTDNNEDWFERVKAGLSEGDVIYEVYALTAPEPLGGEEVLIANVRLQTELQFSQRGDEFLYFRHRPQHLDRKYYPSW